ncbi:hypothetical protein FPOAC2_04117 [Fusarium poae]|uniref:hypothetical protein n=1 Tax=Fusarium poae TaxID=36050 RepID=UPI001CE7D111|nr:hypothetical protein FPOAC1_004048 [Fusarium poae]KAG8670814.1 hypothetical protein FPOAC1_004048 [Fusarium poae]
MGRMRSRNGCLTCRERHVKCDETRPKCGQCLKRHRLCHWEEPSSQLTFNQYQPKHMEHSTSVKQSLPASGRDSSSADGFPSPGGSTSPPDPIWCPQDLISPPTAPSVSEVSQHESPNQYSDASLMSVPWTIPTLPIVSRQEAFYIHHFSTHLARWLDCTDASRQFTLNIPVLVNSSLILRYAVISYAARHLGEDNTAEIFHEKCIELLIPLLSTENIANDEAILCAMVILRVCEQLSVTVIGSDQERHLAGLSALLKTSQGRQVDPSIPTLSQASFWVYVRQCLYNACIHQQPPNLDFELVLIPPPHVVSGQAVDIKSETAWANTMTWICATVVDFCFRGSALYSEPLTRLQRWSELSEAVENWNKTKPSTFDPIWYGEQNREAGPFPEIWFTADWHVMAFGFYHLAKMLLMVYRPSPRFAIRNTQRTIPASEETVMEHARALCGVWGSLMVDKDEQAGMVDMLKNLEASHAWPTAWIIEALEEEWSRY